MKSISNDLLNLFASDDHFYKVDLYTITLIDGTVIRTTDADVDLTWGGNKFVSCAPSIKREKVRSVIGIEVDVMPIDIQSVSDTVNGFTYNDAARQGILDGATVLVETAYIVTWPTVLGVMHAFFGLVSDAEPGRSRVRISVKSALEILSQPFPRNVYQSTCLRTVYSAGCGVNKASFTSTGTVGSSPTLNSINSGLSNPSGYFNQGVLTFTSGPLAGTRRTVKSYAGGAFTFANPLPALPVTGNTFSVYAGCNRTKETCRAVFNNIGRFRGFPFIPSPETTY